MSVPLAIDSYRTVPTLGDTPELLNLCWTVDEREWLSIDLPRLLVDALQCEMDAHAASVKTYAVKDPYGSDALGSAVERYFETPALAAHVSCGAGVTALLHALAAWADHASVLMASAVYPDFAHWVHRRRGAVLAFEPTRWRLDCERLLQDHGATVRLLFIERPSFFGADWDPLENVHTLCAYTERAGVALLIDESNANYCAPEFSAVPLVRQYRNLVVLRGLSKAYSLGGLRLGYCVSSANLTSHVRDCLPALQVSSLSLLIARTVLESGDIAIPLRARIGQMKHRAMQRLSCAGIEALAPCNDRLPYLAFTQAPTPLLSEHGGRRLGLKQQPLWTGASETLNVTRCSVPLREDRMLALETWLAHLERA